VLLLTDDHDLFAEALTVTIELDERLNVVGRARDGREAIELVAALNPDIVLIDLHMPVLDRVEATRVVSRLSPETRVVVVTSSTSKEDERRAAPPARVPTFARVVFPPSSSTRSSRRLTEKVQHDEERGRCRRERDRSHGS
jgi:chemotaxis response regulator CheB